MSYHTPLFRRWYRQIVHYSRRLGLILIFLLWVAPEWPAFGSEKYQLKIIAGAHQFNYVTWELAALKNKFEAALAGTHAYLSEEERQEIVLTYLDWLTQERRLQAEINAIFADSTITTPTVASRTQYAAQQALRQQMRRWQPIVESIIQEQVAAILVAEDLQIGGLAWPPVQFQLTPLPQLLIISPRDVIEQKYSISLDATLDTPTAVNLESQVTQTLGDAAYVTPIGGVGTYPAMVLETTNLNFLVNTVAHEWAHHWLTLHPLGIRYNADPAMRNLNETVAGLVGNEVGAQVIARYYPQFVPALVPESAPATTTSSPPPPPEPPPFDFRAEMAITRVEADRLLAAGDIEEAEAYMETRRQLFVAQGYRLRVLNQAYFAFHGAYAATPGGASGGNDPIGGPTRMLRVRAPNLKLFLETIGNVTSLADLQELSLPASPAN